MFREEDSKKELSTIEQRNFSCSQIPDQNETTQIQMLQHELVKAKLDVRAYSTTITSLQQTLRAMERTIQELRGMESLKSDQKQVNRHTDLCHSTGSTSGNLTGTSGTKSKTTTSCLQIILGPDAPISLYRGTSTSYLCRSYFSPSGSSRVFVYDHETLAWSELLECPNTYFSLVTINGLITAVGGWVGGDRKKPTNTLLSLLSPSPLDYNEDSTPESKRIRLSSDSLCGPTSALSWIEHFPAMPTKRGYPAAVYHNYSLVVAGGDSTWLRDSFLTTVEVLNTITLQWYTASSLPVPLRGSTAAVCINKLTLDCTLYLLGGWDRSGNSVYACSLGQLLSVAIPNDPKETLPNPARIPCSCAWRKLSPAPFSDASCVSLKNRLFAFGGRAWNGEGSDYIYHYCEQANKWSCVGQMSVGRSHPLIAKLADECRAVVVGGMAKGPHITNCCEIVQLNF